MASLADEFLMDMESSDEEEEDNYPVIEEEITKDFTPATLKKERKKFVEPAPEIQNFEADEDDEDVDTSFLNKIRNAAAKGGRASPSRDPSNQMADNEDDDARSSSSEETDYDSDGEPIAKKPKKAKTQEEIEYRKLQKRLQEENAQLKIDKLKQANKKLLETLEYEERETATKWFDPEMQPGNSCMIPDKKENNDAYQVYLLRKDKKKIRFILPERQKTVFDTANLRLSSHYNNILNRLDNTTLDLEKADEETYNLIIDANALLADIDFEYLKVYNFTRDVYTTRFPELETLLQDKVQYLKVAGLLLNELLNAKAVLTDNISDAQVMIVAMTATNTQGTKLTADKIEVVKEACELADNLTKDRTKITRFVKSRMSLLAPNITAIVGPGTAAQLIGKAADGLQGLSRMPGCNVLLLGQEKDNKTFNSQGKLPHAGYIYYSAMVQSVEPDLRRKAARQVANKVVLAARADANLTARERRNEPILGITFRDQIYAKYEIWDEPPKVKGIKALPKPLEHAGKKRRGGKRYRKMKERLGMTEIRKQANRTTFGEIEEDLNQEDLGISLGHLDRQSGSGVIRNLLEEKKSKVRLTKKMSAMIQKEASMNGARTAISSGFRTTHKELGGGKSTVLGWGGTMTSLGKKSSFRRGTGTASSVTFTPVQGLEIVNPDAIMAEKDEEDGMNSTASYFSQPVFKTPNLPSASSIPGLGSYIPPS